MPRKEKKYHYIYKTTCKVNNKFYVGMHSTDNLDDGYIGSGKRLWNSIRKHGKENFEVEILEFFDSREDLRKREEMLVNEDLIQDPLCMNLQTGGGGGFINEAHQLKCSLAGTQAAAKSGKNQMQLRWLWKNDEEWAKRHSMNKSKALTGKDNGKWTGRKHTEETKNKMRYSHKNQGVGQANSQFGMKWIYNEYEKKSIKVHKDELQSWLDQGWILGRKIKW